MFLLVAISYLVEHSLAPQSFCWDRR